MSLSHLKVPKAICVMLASYMVLGVFLKEKGYVLPDVHCMISNSDLNDTAGPALSLLGPRHDNRRAC